MASSFASTRWSQVLAAGSADKAAASAALAWLCERQWEPLRRAARRWGVPAGECEDAVQDFCCRLVERRADLGGLDPAGGRFRAWLVTVFRRFLKDRRVQRAAQVRGGGVVHQDAALSAISGVEADPDFDRDWAEGILAQAQARLAAEQGDAPGCARARRLSAFVARNAEPGEYSRLAGELGLAEGGVAVAVYRLRQRFAELVRQEIRETLADPSPQAVDDELQALIATFSTSVIGRSGFPG
jgi:RNA polymerase sigma-70 factor (ECF subfamily)